MDAAPYASPNLTVFGALPPHMLVLLTAALSVSALGFICFVWFISLGYAFSVTAMAILLAALYFSTLGPVTGLQCLLLAAYGLRLGTFLARREWNTSYRRELDEVRERATGVPLGRRLLVWMGVSLLYVAMVSPALFNLDAQADAGAAFRSFLLPIGVIVMAGGLLLEAAADHQKSAYKRVHPDRFCDTGLYAWVRCPNYLGEITFWIGVWVSGLATYAGLWQWLVALLGVVCIVLIMVGSTKRLEAKQAERYGGMPDFRRYVQTVPVLIPFVPVYSLQKVRVYLE